MKLLKRIPFFLSLVSVCVIIYDLGFDQPEIIARQINVLYFVTLIIAAMALGTQYLVRETRPGYKIWIFDGIYSVLLITVFLVTLEHVSFIFLDNYVWKYLALFAVFVREYSNLKSYFAHQYLNPAQLFIVSFILIILFGAFLLMLPNATTAGISFVDALFTSTSAVCVTGLSVVDTGTAFTQFGHVILILLMQLGGLGIMTFTSYFAYFFRGALTYQNQLMLRELTNSQKVAEVFSVLKKIILVTLTVEVIGIILIYSSLSPALMASVADRFFFSIFHSVAAFCNAGFSTLSANLYDIGVRFNYPLHLTIACLIILGGIGFPILFNLMNYVKYVIMNYILPFSRKAETIHRPWVINLNTRIVVITTGILLLVGTVLIYILEYHNTLAEHHGIGKVVVAFFGSVTPRTAGFNSVDMTMLNFSTIMIIVFLMWVGGSPASTAGGIKTSTLAIATLNFFSLARNKDRVELYQREITYSSIRRASAIICLSLIVIGVSVFSVTFFDQDLAVVDVVFECFSAYGTVGLSLGITAALSSASKVIIIITMFIGRVGMLTLMIAALRKIGQVKYRYPSEEILIN